MSKHNDMGGPMIDDLCRPTTAADPSPAITREILEQAVAKLRDNEVPGPYYAHLTQPLAHKYVEIYGGWIVPGSERGIDGHDVIIDHPDGDLIILVDKS